MKTLTKCSRVYICQTCKTRYSSKKSAQQCESRKMEEKSFKVGYKVKNKEPRFCYLNDGRGKGYVFNGVVTHVIGPLPADKEYELKWLQRGMVNYHVFKYEVSYKCPRCKEQKSFRYYAPELELISR